MFKTERLIIKKFTTLDEVNLFIKRYNNIEDRSEHDHDELCDEEEKRKEFTETKFDVLERSNFMIFNENNEFIGTIGFNEIEYYDVNIGYRIFKPKHRQKGYLSELLPVFSQYVFDRYKQIDRLTLRTSSNNVGSQKVALRSGYTFEGRLRDAYELRGKRIDFLVYSLLRKEQ